MRKLKAKITFTLFTVISWLPFPIMYLLSDLIFFVLFYVIKYRKDVVDSNLRQSFPHKSEQDIQAIQKQFFRHLADVMVESIKSFSISKKEVIRRVEIQNISLLNEYRKQGKNVIVVFGHNSNWEWLGLSSSAQIRPQVYSLYRRIKDPILNALITKNRGRFGLHLISENKAYKKVGKVLSSEENWCLVGFLADQSAHPKRGVWVDFLNQKTIFVKGPSIYAKKTNVPVVFFELRKVKRGFYKGHFEVLIDSPSEYTEMQIMQAFAQRLEKQIREQPAYWLWSHKRWKHQFKGD